MARLVGRSGRSVESAEELRLMTDVACDCLYDLSNSSSLASIS